MYYYFLKRSSFEKYKFLKVDIHTTSRSGEGCKANKTGPSPKPFGTQELYWYLYKKCYTHEETGICQINDNKIIIF